MPQRQRVSARIGHRGLEHGGLASDPGHLPPTWHRVPPRVALRRGYSPQCGVPRCWPYAQIRAKQRQRDKGLEPQVRRLPLMPRAAFFAGSRTMVFHREQIARLVGEQQHGHSRSCLPQADSTGSLERLSSHCLWRAGWHWLEHSGRSQPGVFQPSLAASGAGRLVPLHGVLVLSPLPYNVLVRHDAFAMRDL